MLIAGKKVNTYVNIIKKIAILLLFFLIVYIIMFEYNVFNWLIFAYKLMIVTLLFAIFHFNTGFNQLHQAIYGCLRPIEKMKINVEGISFDIVVALFFLKSLVDNKHKIFETQKMYGKIQLNLKKIPTKNNLTKKQSKKLCSFVFLYFTFTVDRAIIWEYYEKVGV